MTPQLNFTPLPLVGEGQGEGAIGFHTPHPNLPPQGGKGQETVILLAIRPHLVQQDKKWLGNTIVFVAGGNHAAFWSKSH
jgi:hypothetical protein